MPLLDQPPTCGEEHWLAVRSPFSADVSEPFWCLYQPPLSYDHGWAEHPEELGRSAIVCCTLANVVNVRDDNADVLAIVSDVWAIDEISSHLPPRGQVGACFWKRFVTQTVRAACWDDFTFVYGNAEGDVETSALFERRAGRQHLILEGYSGFHEDFVFIGNSLLDAEGEGVLQVLLAR
jgi:hypothetical protein